MSRSGIFALASIGFLMAYQAVNADTSPLPSHWFISGKNARDFVGSVDRAIFYSGAASGVLASRTSNLDSSASGTLMQMARASAYAGKTVVFSAYLRSRDVSGGAGLWFRADDANGLMVAFKNAWARTQVSQLLTGDTDWRKVELVINIPSSAVRLAYGVQMMGSGTVWIDHVQIKARGVGDQSADATPLFTDYGPPPQTESLGDPSNLEFEQ